MARDVAASESSTSCGQVPKQRPTPPRTRGTIGRKPYSELPLSFARSPRLAAGRSDARRHSHQRHAAGNARRGDRARRHAGAARRARRAPRARRQHLHGPRGARAAGHAVGVHRHRRRARGVPARRRHLERPNADEAASERPNARLSKASRRGPESDRAGGQGPDRHQGRAAVDADQRSPAASSSTCRRIRTSASRSASRTKTSAKHLREKLQQLLPPEEKGGFIIRTMAETASDARARDRRRVPAQAVARHPGARASARAAALLYQDLNLALRVLRDFVHEDTARILIDSRETYQRMQAFAREFTPNVAAERWSTTRASARCSISTASRTRSRRRSRAASI